MTFKLTYALIKEIFHFSSQKSILRNIRPDSTLIYLRFSVRVLAIQREASTMLSSSCKLSIFLHSNLLKAKGDEFNSYKQLPRLS